MKVHQWTRNGGIAIERQTRDKKGRYSRSLKFSSYIVVAILMAALIAACLNSLSNKATVSFTAAVLTPPTAHAAITMEAKVEAEKDSILDRLASCESAGKKEADGIAILDSNNVGSYGPFQFQRKTVMTYYEKRTGQKISGRDAIILALQGDKARELAKWIIFETNAGVVSDWTNCSNKLGLQREVDIIKKLEN